MREELENWTAVSGNSPGLQSVHCSGKHGEAIVQARVVIQPLGSNLSRFLAGPFWTGVSRGCRSKAGMSAPCGLRGVAHITVPSHFLRTHLTQAQRSLYWGVATCYADPYTDDIRDIPEQM